MDWKKTVKIALGFAFLSLAWTCPPSITGNLMAGLIGLVLVGREVVKGWRNWLARRAMMTMDQPTVVHLRSGATVVFETDGLRLKSRYEPHDF